MNIDLLLNSKDGEQLVRLDKFRWQNFEKKVGTEKKYELCWKMGKF